MGDDGFPGEQGGKVKRLEHFHFLMDKSFLIFFKVNDMNNPEVYVIPKTISHGNSRK